MEHEEFLRLRPLFGNDDLVVELVAAWLEQVQLQRPPIATSGVDVDIKFNLPAVTPPPPPPTLPTLIKSFDLSLAQGALLIDDFDLDSALKYVSVTLDCKDIKWATSTTGVWFITSQPENCQVNDLPGDFTSAPLTSASQLSMFHWVDGATTLKAKIACTDIVWSKDPVTNAKTGTGTIGKASSANCHVDQE